MNTTTTARINISELQLGDIVQVEAGMRVRVETLEEHPAFGREQFPGERIWRARGPVLNLDELADSTRRFVGREPWTVQGNQRRFVNVERA